MCAEPVGSSQAGGLRPDPGGTRNVVSDDGKGVLQVLSSFLPLALWSEWSQDCS